MVKNEVADPMRLVDIEGATSIRVDVQITDQGDLLFSGRDIGQAPKAVFGESDYEYWLTVSAEDKDCLLMALIETHYSGDASVISELRDTLDSKDISYTFQSYS